MKIVSLMVDNYQVIKTIEITPTGNIVTIGGKNGAGKSSVLGAIWVALAGRAVGPAVMIRKGEEECRIRLDLGEIVVTRRFVDKGDGKITDSVKVESPDGKQSYKQPQAMLNDLLGQIGFDPFAFVQMKPDKQAETLLEMVPLAIDIDELARQDENDFANRRDINRDAAAIKAQFEAIDVVAVPGDAPDRDALVAQLASAADHNTGIERERMARVEHQRRIDVMRDDSNRAHNSANDLRQRAADLIKEAEGRESDAESGFAAAADELAKLAALPALAEPIDTEAVRQQMREAESVLTEIQRQTHRASLVKRHTELVAKSQAFTDLMDAREEDRRKALASAKMPIDGLGFAINEKGKPVVLFNGVPFDQASSAEQIKASTAIAMAANPELRVLRIKDGSLLDDDSMEIIAEMAEADDWQVWVERVSSGGVGIIIEDGSIKGAPEPEAIEPKPRAAKKDAPKPDGALL